MPFMAIISSPSHLRFAAQTRLQMCILRVLRQILSVSLLLLALLLSLRHPLAVMWLAFSLRQSISDCFRSTGANLHQFSVKPVRFRTTFSSNPTDSAPACRLSSAGSQHAPNLHQFVVKPVRFRTAYCSNPTDSAPACRLSYAGSQHAPNLHQFSVKPVRSRTAYCSNPTDSAPICRASLPPKPICISFRFNRSDPAPLWPETSSISHHFLPEPHRFCASLPGEFARKSTCAESAPLSPQTAPILRQSTYFESPEKLGWQNEHILCKEPGQELS
jgi:hypothetical protein